MSIKERINPYADTRVGNPAIFESHPEPEAPVQEPDDSLSLCASDLERSAVYGNYEEMKECLCDVASRIRALTTLPAAQRQWVSLTEDALKGIFNEPDLPAFVVESARAIEAKLREKNTGETK